MSVTVRPAAEADLEQAHTFYESQRPGLGDEFLTEFRRAIDRILQHPRAWQPLDAEYRHCRLHRFPYGVIYRIDPPTDEIVVAAVHHLSRHPDDWRRRGDT